MSQLTGGHQHERPRPLRRSRAAATLASNGRPNAVVRASDFGSNSIVRFDPATERFTTVDLPAGAGSARQLLGRPSQIWGATSGADQLFVIHTT